MKKKYSKLIVVSIGIAGLILCCASVIRSANAGPKESSALVNLVQGKEYRFLGGNATRGKEAFVKLNCNQCHRVAGIDNIPEPKGKRRLDLELAEEIRFVKSYEDIITAVTNPRHVMNEKYKAILSKAELDGDLEPFMPDLTDSMSAKQLIDLVTFLDSAYEAEQPTYIGK